MSQRRRPPQLLRLSVFSLRLKLRLLAICGQFAGHLAAFEQSIRQMQQHIALRGGKERANHQQDKYVRDPRDRLGRHQLDIEGKDQASR